MDIIKEDCIFCRIVLKQTPSNIVYEDDVVMAFLDVDPVSEGHTLIIPKSHADDIFDIDENTLAQVVKLSKRISIKILSVLECEGINIIQNNKEAAGQIIRHYHMHIIPRWKNDGFRSLYAESPPEKDLFSILGETTNKIKLQ